MPEGVRFTQYVFNPANRKLNGIGFFPHKQKVKN